MKKICIYEPALCCETGLCGVNVDPELLRISTVLNTLKSKNVTVERYNLNTSPMEFVKNMAVNLYVNGKGIDALPIVTLDGEIVISGRYPTNEEILNLLDLPAQMLLPDLSNASKGAAVQVIPVVAMPQAKKKTTAAVAAVAVRRSGYAAV